MHPLELYFHSNSSSQRQHILRHRSYTFINKGELRSIIFSNIFRLIRRAGLLFVELPYHGCPRTGISQITLLS
jgi:hypothetical protein